MGPLAPRHLYFGLEGEPKAMCMDMTADETAQTRPTDDATSTILVCDDQEDIVEMLVSVLNIEGFKVLPAYCGAEALLAVQQLHVDLVLLDKALPDIDGFEVCRQIKDLFPVRFLPVIMVTAKAHKQDKLAGLSLGADDYVTKPFDIEELLAKIRVMLRIKRVEDQLYQRNIELASFNAVAGVIGESLILEDMLRNSLAEILRLMDLPSGWIFLWDNATQRARLAVYRGVDSQSANDESLYDRSRLRSPVENATTLHGCDWLDESFRERNRLAACVSIPLTSKGRVLGYMNLASRHLDSFQPSGSDLQVLESLCFELGVAIEHALLYRDARHTVEQLREIARIKSQFISTASHELRTPLSIIKGFANLLARKQQFGFDVDTERQYLALIDDQITSLTMLIDDLLSASRIESGRVQPRSEQIDLVPLIERVSRPIAIQARDREISVDVAPSGRPTVIADPVHLEQIITNLVSNAVKYSDDGSPVSIRICCHEGMAKIEVVDHGVGIAPGEIPRLFERFTRLENRRSVEAGGTGLGLYIARSWVEANGGRIWAQSAPDQGSTFSFTLPLAPAS